MSLSEVDVESWDVAVKESGQELIVPIYAPQSLSPILGKFHKVASLL
jgi:hypothetical protein